MKTTNIMVSSTPVISAVLKEETRDTSKIMSNINTKVLVILVVNAIIELDKVVL